MKTYTLKYYFAIAFILFAFGTIVLFVWQKESNFNNEPREHITPEHIQTLQGGDLPQSFKGAIYTDAVGHDFYKNNMFDLRVFVPHDMEVFESVDIWKQGELEYTDYVISFADGTPHERIFDILIRKTSIPNIQEYVKYHDEKYRAYIIENQEISEYDAVVATVNAPSENVSYEKLEHRLLFIKDGFVFDIMTRDLLSPSELHDIWESVK